MRGTAILATALALIALPAVAADTLTIRMDQSAAVRLSAPARDVVIGNPMIADVNVLDSRRLVVLGKNYGVTNLLVMDQAGRTILERQIVVAAPDPAVNYYHGTEVRAYACSDRCARLADSVASAPTAAPVAVAGETP